MFSIKRMLTTVVCSFLIVIFLSSCQLEMAANKKVSEKELTSRMISMVEREMDNVLPYVKEDIPQMKSLEDVDARTIVMNTLEEDQGRKYLEFCYEIETAATPEEVVSAAEGLVSDEDMELLKTKVEETKSIAKAMALEGAKTLTGEQRRAFYKDLRVLVIKATVLLTAGIVYMCIPKVVLWGKVTAACAVAVAAGVVASAVLSVVEYYQFDKESVGDSFEGWLESITKEPYTAWALAAGIIATGNTMKRSPVLTGIILIIFAIYEVTDDIKPMLKKYNFNI